MRNLKKILALALVFAMAFTFTASAADFTDAAEIGAKYVDDVNMLVELGVIAGYPDGSFGPQKNITRAEFAKMAYTIKYGSDTDGNLFAAQKSNFWDVEGNANVAWAKGYINYCANQNIVSGVGGGKFNPSGNITVAEATKMLLVILGCDPAKEGFTGANWVANVTAKAIDLGIYNGWTGDPSVLATRELVAKLMHNTIFSSVYTYSAITGAGSQLDALGQDYNKTLGEVTMNLQKVTGIVVANERYALATDEEGEELQVNIPNVKEDESVVYFEKKDDKGNTYYDTITLDRALDDDMLGAKVNVYFTADTIENSGRLNYKNIEVIGNVLVHSDTVAYTVPAIATKIMPDGESTSNSTIRPYISFIVDGVEKQIVASKDVAKIAKSVDAGDSTKNPTEAALVGAEFNKYAYMLNGQTVADDGDYDWMKVEDQHGNAIYSDTAFIDGMNKPSLEYYRFVSVDGGETYSYLFKTVDSRSSGYGAVTSYSEARGTIKVTNTAQAFDLDEVVLVDEVAVDDYVVYYRANGKVYIEKVDALTAAVDDFTDDNGVILGGNAYYAWTGADIIDYTRNEDIYTHFYKDDISAMNGNAKYFIYNNIIMQIEVSDEEVIENTNYGVILRSWYDEEEEMAFVKLGFADNTEGTYAIGKLTTKKASEPDNTVNDLPRDFAGNAYFGMVVKYKIRDDGTIDLSGQYFKDNDFYRSTYVDGTDVVGAYAADGTYVASNTQKKSSELNIYDGKFTLSKTIKENGKPDVNTSTSYYALNNATVVFALYGTPGFKADGAIDVETDGFFPVKSRAYKTTELKEINSSPIDTLYVSIGGQGQLADDGIAHLILNSKTDTNKYVVAASISVGANTKNIKYNVGTSYAYVVSAKQIYNPASRSYYANLVLINEDGLFTAKTVDNVENFHATAVLTSDVVGPIDDENGTIPAGTFVRYNMNAEGVITTLDKDGGEFENISKTYDPNALTGMFLVNIIGRKGDVVTFFDTDSDVDTKNTQAMSDKFHEDGCDIISISGDEYVGESITYVPSQQKQILTSESGNAIIQIEDGAIVRIFSFTEGYAFADYVD